MDGIPLGRFAAYQPLLLTKQESVTASDEVWSFYLDELETLLRLYRPFERMYAALAPRAAYTMNQFYGSHRLFLRLAEARGLPRWSVGPGALTQHRYESALFFPAETSSQTVALSATVLEALAVPLTDLEIGALAEHQRSLIDGTDPWVYSARPEGATPKEVRSRLGVRDDSRVFTVLMASPDEMRAAEAAGAEIRIALNAQGLDLEGFVGICLSAAASMPEADFVIRLHPRLYPNKRETTRSPDAERIVAMFDEAPGNVHLCRPGSGISLYDNLLVSDAAMNFTSTSGAEFLAFGVPVYHFDSMRLGAYPAELGSEALSAAELVRLLSQKDPQEMPVARIRGVYRWWATLLCRTAVFLSPIGGEQSQSTDAQEEVRSRFRAAIQRVLPGRAHAAIGNVLELRGRRSLTLPVTSPFLADEVHAQVSATVEPGERDLRRLWRPNVVMRGSELPDEDAVVLGAVANQLRHLGWMRFDAAELSHAGRAVRILVSRLQQGEPGPSTR